MKFKYHRWFQWLVVPFVALAFHIYFGYRIIGRENIPEGGCVVCPIFSEITISSLES